MAYVSYKKLSKKKRREIDQGKRATWGSVSPVTKKVKSAKVYNRKKIQQRQRESPPLDFLVVGFSKRSNFVTALFVFCCAPYSRQQAA